MLTVHQVSEYTGLSIRTLQYYDKIGLLHAAEYTEAGYRLYDDSSLESLQQIMLFRELEFPLQDIKKIITSKTSHYCPRISKLVLTRRAIRTNISF